MRETAYDGERVRVAALEWEGDGPPVVLLHGACGNALWWTSILPALAGRHVVALDLPGHGGTPPVDDWESERLAREVAGAIARRHPEPVVLGGHSWGGKLSAIAAGVLPERVRGLLLVDPSPASPVPITPAEFVDGTFGGELGPWRDVEEAVREVRAQPHYRRWTPEVEAAVRRGLETLPDGSVIARHRREWLVPLVADVLTRDHSALVSRVACPTLLLIADESLFWQEPTNVVALPRAERVVVTGNHFLHVDARAELVGLIRAWLDRLPDS
jgi:pimeloyl-ACP methyl ester carboxylesterase